MSDRPADDDEDDFELELEPIDPEIVAHERRRAQEKTDDALASVKFDEIDKEPDRDDHYVDWRQLRSFRFTTRHLFILTAILAIGLTLRELLGGCMGLFVMGLALIVSAWFVVTRQEQRRARERERRRKEFYASQGQVPRTTTADDDSPWLADPVPRPEFRFAFSLKQVFLTVTAAAVLLAILTAVGPKALTITLGLLAVAGLFVQTVGWFDPPPAIVFGWWVLLVFYLFAGAMTVLSDYLSECSPRDGLRAAACCQC